MKKFLFGSIVLLVMTAGCNSGGGDKKDAAATDSMPPMTKDTAHSGMNMADTVMALPAIPDGAKVFFKNLKDGQSVKSPLKVEMGAEGIKVDTAGHIVPGVGHHHLYIDAGDSSVAGLVVPKDSTHLHFGKAQTEATITLTPGKHRLALQFADGIHRSYGGRLSAAITVDVKK